MDDTLLIDELQQCQPEGAEISKVQETSSGIAKSNTSRMNVI